MIKNIIKPIVPNFILTRLRRIVEDKQLKEWKRNGQPVPPPHIVKQIAIAEFQKKLKYNILVETGTYLGNMIEAQKERFTKVFSIELSRDLYKKAQKRFRKDKHVVLVQGDSGKVMPNVLNEISEPAIFWLDGHYSSGITAKGEKDCPIYEELDAILKHKEHKHVLLIDDARCFNGTNDYPTIENLIEFVKNKNQDYQVEIKDDIIRFFI